MYVAEQKAYFMKHFPYRQVLGELDTSTGNLREWSLPYQDGADAYWRTSIVVDSKGIVFFEVAGKGLHRFVPETGEFTKFNVEPDHIKIDSSDVIYLNLSRAISAVT